jgi:hypothetical protein
MNKTMELSIEKENLLTNYLADTQTVYAVSRGSSASGMTHYFTLLVAGLNNKGEADIFNITYQTAQVLGYKLVDRDGHRVIKVQGGGMDMGFHLVYELSSVLYSGVDRAGYILRKETI